MAQGDPAANVLRVALRILCTWRSSGLSSTHFIFFIYFNSISLGQYQAFFSQECEYMSGIYMRLISLKCRKKKTGRYSRLRTPLIRSHGCRLQYCMTRMKCLFPCALLSKLHSGIFELSIRTIKKHMLTYQYLVISIIGSRGGAGGGGGSA